MTGLPRLYTELAPWFPILTAPEDVGFSPRSVHLDIGDEGEVYEGFLAVK